MASNVGGSLLRMVSCEAMSSILPIIGIISSTARDVAVVWDRMSPYVIQPARTKARATALPM